MHWPGKLDNLLEMVSKTSLFLANILVAVSSIIIIAQILMRYFSYSFSWAEELSRFLIIYMVFFASACLIRDESNPRVEIFYERFSPRAKFWVNNLFYVLVLFFLAVLFWQGVKQVTTSLADLTPALRVSWAIPYVSIPLGSLLMAVQLVYAARTNYLSNWKQAGREGQGI